MSEFSLHSDNMDSSFHSEQELIFSLYSLCSMVSTHSSDSLPLLPASNNYFHTSLLSTSRLLSFSVTSSRFLFLIPFLHIHSRIIPILDNSTLTPYHTHRPISRFSLETYTPPSCKQIYIARYNTVLSHAPIPLHTQWQWHPIGTDHSNHHQYIYPALSTRILIRE